MSNIKDIMTLTNQLFESHKFKLTDYWKMLIDSESSPGKKAKENEVNFNSGDTLMNRGGASKGLIASYYYKNANTLTDFISQGNKNSLILGSNIKSKKSYNYAWVHEKGATIADRNVLGRSSKSGKSIKGGVMQNYFWYRYFQTKHLSFKYVALALKKKGYIIIKARPVFAPAWKAFKDKTVPQWIQSFYKQWGDLIRK